MASDQPLRRRLGDVFPATIRVSGAADREEERYPLLEEKLEIDLSGLSQADVARLLRRLETADLVISVQKKLCDLFGVDPMTGERISQR